jgi:diguanylate cyclase (GGDEF)-like protein
MRTTQPNPEESRPRVLVIDDSADVHRLLKVKLGQEEAELVSALTGEDGLAKARAVRPAAILLDLNMPGTDGLMVIRQLKSEDATHHIPIIVISAMSHPEDKIAAFELGAADYLTKPFEFTELRVRLRATLRLHRLLQLLAQRAHIDGLTGLWNRSLFNERWAQEVARSQRQGHPLSLAILDIDHFKQINDRYGHPTGDQVLVQLAKIFTRESRESDVACRYGGEEFALIMPDTSGTAATIVCERIRAAVEAATWPDRSDLRVTISCGVAGANDRTTITPAEWVETADRNLYAAKRNGRNRVIHTEIPTTPSIERLAG